MTRPLILYFFALVTIYLLQAGNIFAATPLQVSKGLQHYVREMEYYYQKPRPEILPQALKLMSGKGLLAKSENRLMLAAFLVSACANNPAMLSQLADQSQKLGKDARHTMAWSIHLSRLPDKQAMLDKILSPADNYLKAQIQRAPADLNLWDAASEQSILQMYWGAFMGSGNEKWLVPVIDTAMAYARATNPGNLPHGNHGVGREAASSLYEFAPRHEAVRKLLQSRLAQVSGAENKMIKMILRE